MRRYSFNIDLSAGQGAKSARDDKIASPGAPQEADGFQMSEGLSEQRQALRLWPSFQRALMKLPDLLGTSQEWDDPNQGAEFVRIYGVSKEKILDAAPGFEKTEKIETHCFFQPDGTKHLVSRLLARPHHRVNELRLGQDGRLVRLYYENQQGKEQILDDLFAGGLLGLEEDVERFARFPHYVFRFLLLNPDIDRLKDVFRGVCYFDPQKGEIVSQEG